MALSCGILALFGAATLRRYDNEVIEIFDQEDEPLLDAMSTDSSDYSGIVVSPDSVFHRPPNVTPILLEEISCFASKDAYLLAFNMFTLVGSGLMYTNNIGAICTAN